MTDEHSPPDTGDERAALLEAAYAVKSPDDSRELYAKWAPTYEQFLDTNRYIYARQVAELYVQQCRAVGGPALDAGCGTGRVGLELSRLGVGSVDGIDISPEMLDEARTMTGPTGAPAYRRLMEADLTGAIDIESGTYAGVVSSGAFTHGHLGPDTLSELLRVARPGAVAVIGVNASLFESNGFKDRFERYASDGVIAGLEVQLRQVYDQIDPGNDNHLAHIAVFTVV